jgi:hypothetical protein
VTTMMTTPAHQGIIKANPREERVRCDDVWDRLKRNRPSPDDAGAEARVRQLIADGNHKDAVDAAKDLHKAQPTAASEALLIDAYRARIQSLFDRNLAHEANALLDLVCERFPSARERLKGSDTSAGIHPIPLDELLRPLNDPELSEERRAAIETSLARDLVDLAALAGCAALPAEHPLRQAATALQRAFVAVTEGPVSEDALELPEISRRNPLASWKLLLRAIGSFYRGDDQACRRSLDAIKPESAPARLLPAMRAMLGGTPVELTPASTALQSSVTRDPAPLRKSLEALDAAFDTHQEAKLLKAIREATQSCRGIAPDQFERLKQHMSVRCALLEIAPDKVGNSMGGGSRHDAYFMRLLARGLEEIGEPNKIASACMTWDLFQHEAVREGWFKADGPEVATLYLHMAGVLRKLPHQLLTEMQKAVCRNDGKSPDELYFLYPEKLYQRACALDPHIESFSQWLDWVKRHRKGQAEDVAEAWHKARPTDIEPILFVMERRENRNAFHTSLQYLAKAERIDSVNPAVRRARLRLLTSGAIRHLQQQKPHLAEQKLAELQALPQSQQGDRPALLAALRFTAALIRFDSNAAQAHRAEAERLLGGKAAAGLLLAGVAGASKQTTYGMIPPLAALSKTERSALPEAVVRVTQLAKDLEINQTIPSDWLEETIKQFPRCSQSLSAAQLLTLAEFALMVRRFEFAYTVSGAGLERDAITLASFLVLRAQSMQTSGLTRWAVCASAAAQLARQRRQMDVVEKAVELLGDSPFEDLTLTLEQASEVVTKEKAERAFPTVYRPGPNYSAYLGEELCNCPKCRRERGQAVGPFEALDGDDDDLDAMLDDIEFPPGMPPEIAQAMFGEIGKAVQRGESIDSLLNRLFGPGAGFGGKRKKGRRR